MKEKTGSESISARKESLPEAARKPEIDSDPVFLRIKRMRWHCRRGTRELDRVLERWLDENAATADDALLARFEAVLACEDRELQRWILGYHDCDQVELKALVDEIRAKPLV